MASQVARFGFQTHHIQLRAAIVLREITANGLHLDGQRRDQLMVGLEQLATEKRETLRVHGYLPGEKGNAKALQAIFTRLERDHPELVFPRTDSGQYATSHDVLLELADTVPFVQLLMGYRAVDKLCGSFLNKMAKPCLHPSFNVLTRTGRTTSFGEINAQNLPRDDRVRSCFVPSPGHMYIDADYSTIELGTLAQACISQFGLDSKMGEAINAGQDLHQLFAARVTGEALEEVSKPDRQNAKAINFGKPGGMGNKTLRLYAKTTFGVELDENQVQALADAWFELFPEMRQFLGDHGDRGLEVATLLGLTPADHAEQTGDSRFLNHPENVGRGCEPHSILGSMLLKTLTEEKPTTRDGRPYSDADVEYFWSRLTEHIGRLPKKFHRQVQGRRPSLKLRYAVCALVGLGGVFTLSGRLRAHAGYCARHNTVFQGLFQPSGGLRCPCYAPTIGGGR
jgi:hypothetical protein